MHCLLVASVAGFWQSPAPPPIITVPISPTGAVFTDWAKEDGFEGLDDSCLWWNGTYYYDPVGHCNSFSITRVGANDAAKAIDRANRCAALATTDCVLSGEIGFSLPAAFIYDDTEGMRMLIAPRLLPVASDVATKTVRLQDPTGEHPNQLFEFNNTVRVEYLKGGARIMETAVLEGNDAYCIQALRRAIVPACWEALD